MAARADVAVPASGPVFRGEVRIDAEKGQAVLGGTPQPLTEILLVERDDGTLVWCASFERRVAGYRRIVHEGRRERLVEMLREAIKARDPALAKRLLEQARAEGFSGKEEDIQRRRLENLEKRPGKRRDEQAQQVEVAAAALAKELPDLLLARARIDAKEWAPLLREALREKSDHEAALALLKDRAPKPPPFGSERAWLDWAIDFERWGFRLVPDDATELKKARHYWRPDLMGIASSEIMVLTPLRDMEALRDIAMRAHLACVKLRELFRTDTPKLRPQAPILVYIELNKENFQEQIKNPITNPYPPYFLYKFARWSLTDDITRILWSPAEKDWNDVAYGGVHEVVRHWLWTRNPRYSLAETNAADPNVAGYWAEAGLASLVAEAYYDVAAGTVELATGAPVTRKFVREHGKDLIPWNILCLYGRNDVHVLNRDEVKQSGFWASYIFERQATMLSQYFLVADGGKRREAFLDYFVNRCRGEQPKLAPVAAFGMSAEEIGTAASAWVAKSD